MKITNPEQLTYFICRDADQVIKAYGSVDVNQEMVTPHPIVDEYLDEQDYLNALEADGIIIEDVR